MTALQADQADRAGRDDRGAPPSTLALRRDGAVLHVTLNRPQVRNAMSLAMVGELRAALGDAERAGDVRALVLRGAGGHFCAGADLSDLVAARQSEWAEGADPVADVNAAFGALCVAFAQTGLATVAVLEGTVMGGGLGLACVVDVALADASASLRLPETSLGVVPAQIAAFLVERVGYSQARRLAVTGGRLDATQALAIGLVHQVLPLPDNDTPLGIPSALDEALAATLADILRCGPNAIAATKALMARARLERPSDLVADAARIFAQAVRGAEGTEGTVAFLQKRAPSWAAR